MQVRAILAGVLSAAFLAAPTGAQRGPSARPGAPRAAPRPSPGVLDGQWAYNRAMSLDLATGRPELGSRPGDAPGAGVSGVGGMDGAVTMSSLFASERRALVRDLLEVPRRLTLLLTDAGMSITDDLDRERVYPMGDRMQKFQLGAARFDARVSWDGSRLRKDIEGPAGFKMAETFFLSADSERLFVVVRVGDPEKKELLAARNRVYDRASAAR